MAELIRPTNARQKIITSGVNAGISLITAFAVGHFFGYFSLCAILIFFLLNIIGLIRKDRREIGMLIMRTYWAERYPLWQHVVFLVFYTASFATLFIWVWFPFDIFLINMFFLQLPFVLMTGTTFHGYMSGNMKTVIQEKK